MRLICKGIILLAIIFPTCASAEAEMDTSTLVKGWQAFQRAQAGQASPVDEQNASIYVSYIPGIVDAASHYRSYSCPLTLKNACNAVGQYLEEYPELLHGPAVR
jgi:hypothetical protein